MLTADLAAATVAEVASCVRRHRQAFLAAPVATAGRRVERPTVRQADGHAAHVQLTILVQAFEARNQVISAGQQTDQQQQDNAGQALQ